MPRVFARGSRTFFAASLALPHAVREPATALYAFCRMADDAIDLGTNHEAALRELHLRLELIYSGSPRDIRPTARSRLRPAIRHPQTYPLALLEGSRGRDRPPL